MLFKVLISSILLTTPLLSACQQADNTPILKEKISASHRDNMHPSAALFSGRLEETFDVGGYTYIKIKFNQQTIWAAGPITKVKIDDQISFSGRMPMKNFHSQSLNRDFPIIYFVSSFTVNGKNQQIDKVNPHKNTNTVVKKLPLKDFNKAENGQNISDILTNKDQLVNKKITIRGQVSKFTANVMGKNWIHIRDHSSQKDLTITTNVKVSLGDIILLQGKVVKDKDFGYGYIYDVIIEDAQLIKK